ncbi:unnamed protein product [Calicophoron daubneyi]|uniref:Neuroendocrine protein 7B2 n=1 Tax=Calicophoron daubneyi TaxID=300641 RepID=A0AAV2TBD4_CALDB
MFLSTSQTLTRNFYLNARIRHTTQSSASFMIMRQCQVKFIGLIFATLVAFASARDYRGHSDGSSEANENWQDEFLPSNPRDQSFLDQIHSDEYRELYPLADDSLVSQSDFERPQRKGFIRELKNAEESAIIDGASFLQLEPTKTTGRKYHLGKDYKAVGQESAFKNTGRDYQNQNGDENKVPGKSREVGDWLNYVLLGASSQDANDDDDEEARLVFGNADGSYDVVQPFKNDKLPAYCDPPNPCPIGYDPDRLPTPCDSSTNYTMELNREWILQKVAVGECTCDTEHMESCSLPYAKSRPGSMYAKYANMRTQAFLDNPYMQGQKRKRLVPKKTYRPKLFDRNRYLNGKVLRSVVKKAIPRYPASPETM